MPDWNSYTERNLNSNFPMCHELKTMTIQFQAKNQCVHIIELDINIILNFNISN